MIQFYNENNDSDALRMNSFLILNQLEFKKNGGTNSRWYLKD